uniref:RNA-directed RNA polymerase L n=1 Tax=Camp Ripley virus TaxID=460676 RepID=A0A068EUP9_9VIRU|nr:RNA-dependent RNA polymerase [Camp Ripley virus]
MDRYIQLEKEIRDMVPGSLSAIECIDLLDKLYSLRHDLVDEMVKHDWSDNKESETPVITVLLQMGIGENIIKRLEKIHIPNHPTGKTLKAFMKMTPDNYKIEGNCVYFKEVTVTADVDRGIREKMKKYSDGFVELQNQLSLLFKRGELNKEFFIYFDVISVKTDGSNISTQWPSRRNAGVVQHMRLVNGFITYTREHLCSKEERNALEAMFNLKFFTSKSIDVDVVIPKYDGMPELSSDFQEVVDYSKYWLETNQTFSFSEVSGQLVSKSFDEFEQQQRLSYPTSIKPRNFLLIQVALLYEYQPATIASDQLDTIRAIRELLHVDPATPVQYLVRDMLHAFDNLQKDDIQSYYSHKGTFERTNQVSEPGTFKLCMSRLDPESRKCVDMLSSHTSKLPKEIESLCIVPSEQANHCLSIVTKILSDLEVPILDKLEGDYKRPGRTYVDTVLNRFIDSELSKFLLKTLKKTAGWHIGQLVRDITEALIAHSGLKRSKYWSVHAFHNGNVVLLILPSKSLETAASYIRYITVFKEGVGLYDPDNIDSKVEMDSVNWIYSKVISIDLNRLLALNTSFEKALVSTAVWFQYYTEDQGHFPFQSAIRSVFSFHFLLSVCQKMKTCALFDNLRYLIPSCTALYSGASSLIEKFVIRPFKNSLDVYIYTQSKKLLITLAQNNRARFFSKVRLLGVSVDLSTVGASGVYPSLISNAVYKHYRSLISEATTCFFIFEKGLHGPMTEEAKVHEETVEWAMKFRKKEEVYGEDLVRNGYTVKQLWDKPELAEQQLYCVNISELAAMELNQTLIPKANLINQSLATKNWKKPYFSQPRNISLKGMSGEVQEDGHLASSYTLIEAVRYLSTKPRNPTLMQLYHDTRKIRAQARIVRKQQRTEADRGFFIVTLPTRVRLEIIEDYFDAVAKHVNEEYISYGGDRKIIHIQHALERALRWASGVSVLKTSLGEEIKLKRRLMYVSVDATKWSPGDNSSKFKAFTNLLLKGHVKEDLKNCVIDALRNIYETEFFMSRRLRAYLEKMDEKSEHVNEFLRFFSHYKNRSGLVRGNWLQGNLNKCSSLYSVGVSLLFKHIWQTLFEELDCFIEVAHHSDDALFIYGYVEPEGDKSEWYMYVSHKVQAGDLYWHAVNEEMWKTMFNLHEHILLLGSIKVSPKKTTVSNTNAEFLSTFFEGCAVSLPFTKVLLGSLSDLPGLGYFDDLAAGQSRCVKAMDLGASPQVAQFTLGVVNSRVERMYGTAKGMINEPHKFLRVDKEDIPIPLGGLGSNSIIELSTAGIGMSDKCSLRKALTNHMHRKRGDVSYHLGLFKFLMNLKEEIYDHETLGEFSFMGKVQWKIFTPKNEYEFHDLYSPIQIKKWSLEHPVYDYLIPSERNDLLIYLVRKLNDPSIVTAMTLQSPLQLRYRMQSKQHMCVCKYNDEWVTFRDILALADTFAANYRPSEQDLDLFRTLADCTFSKEFAWQDYLNTVDCEITYQRRVHKPKVAKTFTVKERDQNIQNAISTVIAYRFANEPTEIADVINDARYPDSLGTDLKILREGIYRELGLNIDDPIVMKRVAPMLYKSARSRIVIVQGNVEGTAEGICNYWLRSMSFIKGIKVIPHREVLKAVSIFNVKHQQGDVTNLAALRICVEIWRWCKFNNQDYRKWMFNLWFEDMTLLDWARKFQRSGVPLVDPEVQCAGLMLYDLFGDQMTLQVQANRRAYSGKQYDAYCTQVYNEETKLYEGDLRVTFNFGLDCARLEIFWDTKEYVLETSITQKHVLKIMMEEVSKELVRCGMRFKTEHVQSARSLVLFKTESGFEWGKPNIPCIVYKQCNLRTGLRTGHTINHKFFITLREDGLKAIAQYDDESPRFLLAHAFHTLRDIRYQAVDAVGNIWFTHKGVKLCLNPIINSGLLENFMKSLPAAIPPAAYSLIMSRAKISVDLFMFNDLLAKINPQNTLDLSGLEMTTEGFSTISTMSSKVWSEEVSLADDDSDDLCDEYTIDLDDIDFDNMDIEADIEHFLQDESAYTDDLLISSEETEVKKMRGIIKVLEPIRLIKSWVSRGLSIEKVYNPISIILMTRYLSKSFNFRRLPVTGLDPYDLTELEGIVKGWGETVLDNFEELDQKAHVAVTEKGIVPEDVLPDSLFSFRHTMILLRRLFPQDTVSSFY